MQELRELGQNKPRNKNDEALIAEITRLEPAHQVARDDLVSTIESYIHSSND